MKRGRDMLRLVCVIGAMLLISGCVMAPRWSDGYARLPSPGRADVDRSFAISIGPSLIRLAARFMDDEPETQALLRSIDGVRVRVYEVTGDAGRVADNIGIASRASVSYTHLTLPTKLAV